MQDNNRFFQLIWRVNALAIAGVAVIAALLGIFALIAIFIEQTRDREVSDVLTIDPQKPREDGVRLGYPDSVLGTQFTRLPLYREQKTSLTYYSKSSSDNMVNDLFVDTSTGQSQWLFKGTDRLILSQRNILRQLQAPRLEATSIVYTLIEKDTSGDGRLASDDRVSVGFSATDGTSYTALITDIEKLFSVEQVADDKVMIVYVRGGESRFTIYSTPGFAVLSDKALPKLEDAI